MPLKELITVADGEDVLVLNLRVWKGPDRQGIASLEPEGDKARMAMIECRDVFRERIAWAYRLDDVVIYESQGNGLFTPSRPNRVLHHGASINEAELRRLGKHIEDHGWKPTMDLAKNRLPPPVPDMEWPTDW